MFEDIGNVKKDIQEYLEIKLDLFKLNLAESISRIITSVASVLIIGFLSSLILLFASFAAGYFIASRLNSNEAGFLCVAGFYFFLLLLFLLLRKYIIERPVIRSIIKLLFPKSGDDEKK